MDSPSAPTPPDPYVTANAQAGANSEAARLTAQLNRPDQITPFGTLRWSQAPGTRTFDQAAWDAAMKQYGGGGYGSPGQGGPATGTNHSPTGGSLATVGDDGQTYYGPGTGGTSGTGGFNLDRNDPRFWKETPSDKWTSEIILDPKVKAILDAQMDTSLGLSDATKNALGRVNDVMGQPLNFDADSLVADRRKVEDTIYGQHKRTLDPEWQQREDDTRAALINRGFMEGTEAYDKELDRLMRGRNDAYDVARRSAITGSTTEHDRQIRNLLTGRNQVLNELASLRSGQQVNMPQFAPGMSGATVAPTPIANILGQDYQSQVGMYNSGVAGNNSMMGAGMASAATIAAAMI